MCELLGLSFNKAISPTFSLQGLLAGAEENPHGWGLAAYPLGSATAMVLKEPVSGISSPAASFLTAYRGLRSLIFLAHVRRSSRGARTFDNTHPFSRYFCRREFLFAHNGTLSQPPRTATLKFKPIGETDSERAFCSLLTRLSEERIYPRRAGGDYLGFTAEQIPRIHQHLTEINVSGAGTFTCLFTDGHQLFCFRDIHGARGLHWLERQAPFATTTLRDQDMTIDLNLEKGADELGVVTATRPLSDEESWRELSPGELTVVQGGRVVYQETSP